MDHSNSTNSGSAEQTCKRCGNKFNPNANTNNNCKYHDGQLDLYRCAKMVGGGLSTSKWSCCEKLEEKGNYLENNVEVVVDTKAEGCKKGNHITN